MVGTPVPSICSPPCLQYFFYRLSIILSFPASSFCSFLSSLLCLVFPYNTSRLFHSFIPFLLPLFGLFHCTLYSGGE